jgi:phosphatidate cytidylyltransferase
LLFGRSGRFEKPVIGSRDGWIVFSGVIAALLLASLIGFVLARRLCDSPSRPGAANLVVANLNTRIKAWWVMVLILASALMAGSRPVTLLFVFVSFAALREFITLTRTRKADHMALVVGFLLVLPGQYILVWTQWYGVFTIFIPVYAFLILPAFQVISTADTRDFLARTSTMQWGLMIAVYCISHVPALLMLSIPGHDPALLIVFSILVVQASDVFQYVCGKLFGRHQIAPAVSPSKTVEGFVGGIACATALGAGLWWITPFNIWQAAAMSLLIATMGFVGGLVMSAIKRDRGVKDWGRLVEGHGGILDRLDSVCFAAPVFFHLTRYFFTV